VLTNGVLKTDVVGLIGCAHGTWLGGLGVPARGAA
jgi:hypothetical protein